MGRKHIGGALLATMALACASPAPAQTVAEFYAGKRVTMYIGSSAAGGTDLYGRIIAAHIGAHIPGNPNVVVSNVPGANGMILANQIYNTLAQDGTALATFDRYIAMQAIVGNPSVKFDPAKLNWIGSANVDISTCVTWHTSGVKTMADFMSKEFAVGSTAIYHPNILTKIFGAKFKLVQGYPGGNEIDLAVERGELQGRCHWSWSAIIGLRPDWVRDKKINVVLQFSDRKHPEMPDVPLVTELVKTQAEREILDLILSSQEMARVFAAGPGVPPERVEAIRRAFEETMSDPVFVAAAQQKGVELQLVPGVKIQELIARTVKTPPEVVARFKDVVLAK